ncbi:MAG: glycosyltransferase family 2 protein [Bryobacteraceae bacterium]
MLAFTSSTTSRGFSSEAATGSLTIAIVTWNVCELLCECLQSLADDGVPEWADVVVVDNCSADATVETVRKRFPWARVEAKGENLGFSRSNNYVLERCETEFALLLNPDTVVHPGAVRALVDHMIANPRTGAVGPRQVSRDGSVQYEAAVALPTVWNVASEWLLLNRIFRGSRIFDGRKLGHWDHSDTREVPAIPGSAMLLRMSALAETGLLDETMFIIEDMDLCRRLREAGWRVDYLATHSILHYGGESIAKKGGGFKCQVAYQSFWLYLRKHDGRLPALALTAFVWVWSVTVLGLAGASAVVAGGRTPARLRQWREWASGLLAWSVADKWKFEHGLAASPRRPA